MKKIILVLSLILITSVSYAKTRGGYPIKDRVNLVGVNVPSNAGNYQVSISPGMMNYYKSKNYNIIRVPFNWSLLQPTIGGPLSTSYLNQLKSVANLAAERDMGIIFDNHSFGNRGGPLGAGFSAAQLADFWVKFATEFVGRKGVIGYDIMNEPYDSASSGNGASGTGAPQQALDWFNAYQLIINEIRKVDTQTPIYIEGFWWSSAFWWTREGYSRDYYKLVDPSNKLVFSAHGYPDRDSSGGHFIWAEEAAAGDVLTTPTSTLDTNILLKRFTPFVEWCNLHSLKCNIGETAVSRQTDSENWLITLDKLLAYLNKNNVSLTYWAAGSIWGDGYLYSAEPKPSGSDQTQTVILTKYTGAKQPDTYYISGPTRGTSQSPSSNFVVDYYGKITTPITITPNDQGAGGYFNPSSITFSEGYNGSGVFSYVAPAESTYHISTSNNSNLRPPQSVVYTTAIDQLLSSGASAVNILGLRKIYAPYEGPAIRLRRSSDNAEKDFGFTGTTVNSHLDTDAISEWARTSTIYVVTWYDQSPNHYNATMISADAGQTPALSDQPTLILNCQNGKPCIYFNGSNQMDATSPITNNTQQSILIVSAPNNQLSGTVVGWNWAGCPSPAGSNTMCLRDTRYVFGNGTWSRTDTGTVRNYSVAGKFSATAGTWVANTSQGLNTFLNGQRTNTVAGTTSSDALYLGYNRSNLSIGYDRAANPNYVGKISEIIIAKNRISNESIVTFQNDQATYWGIPSLSSFVWPTPTLQQNLDRENDPPWAGLNQSGAVGEFGLGTNFVTPLAGQMYYASRGFNIVRLPISWKQLQPNLHLSDTSLDPVWAAKLDNVVRDINAAGMDVLIDNHSYGAYSFNGSATVGVSDGSTKSYTYQITESPSSLLPMNRCSSMYDSSAPTLYYTMNGELRSSRETSAFWCNGGTNPRPFYVSYHGSDISSSSLDQNTGAFSITFGTAPDAGTPIYIKWTVPSVNMVGDTYANHLVADGLVAFWTNLALRYANNPKVKFDLMNEPAGKSAALQAPIYQRIIDSSRAQGFRGHIFTEFGSSYAECRSVASGVGAEFVKLVDPLNKLVLECHNYLQSCNYDGCGEEASQGSALNRLQSATAYCADPAHPCKLFWGEFNGSFTPSTYAELKVAFELMRANPDVWTGWTEFAGGPAWGDTYQGLLEPRSFNQPIADRPQMRFFSTYATGGTWPTAGTGVWPDVLFP